MSLVRRVIVVSDLHIGGKLHPMLGNPGPLIDFLGQLASYTPPEDEEIELVINGDFIDFLAEEPGEAWTASENDAVTKLEAVSSRLPELFGALALCARRLRRFTVLLGNHDVELAYPRVRDLLYQTLATEPHRCHFIYDNQSYRVGEMLIEHGNRYDPWNAVDHDGLREVVSCASRGERPPRQLVPSPGSRLVCEVINPLKGIYHFVDLLKPEDRIVALLLTTLEPELATGLPLLFNVARSYIKQFYRSAIWKIAGTGAQPGQRQFVASAEEDGLPAAVEAVFAEELEMVGSWRQNVGLAEVFSQTFIGHGPGSLKALLESGQPIEAKRLRKLQVSLASKLYGDKTFDERDKDSEGARPYVRAAQEMVTAGAARMVVMGHTHLRRDIRLDGGGRYLNTGTWARLMRVEPEILEDSELSRDRLVNWLRMLVTDQLDTLTHQTPTYADIRVLDGGVVDQNRSMLRTFSRGEPFPHSQTELGHAK